MRKKETGVIYYKLSPGYEGDTTKCKLDTNDFDSNFHFLRGYDIKDVQWDDENDKLISIRVNGDKIETPINLAVSSDGSYFDKETGILHLIVNGKENEIEGFLPNTPIEASFDRETGVLTLKIGGQEIEIPGFRIFKDKTISGDGSQINPLSVSLPYQGSFHHVAKKILGEEEKLPEDANIGDCYVTTVQTPVSGYLYNSDAVKAIARKLAEEGSDWHIPTYTELSQMLNGVESGCDGGIFRNHEDKSVTIHGEQAGNLIKKTVAWDDEYDIPVTRYKFNAVPTFTDESGVSSALFWCIDGEEVVLKKITNEGGTVEDVRDGESVGSVRLVKDSGEIVPVTLGNILYDTACMPYCPDGFSSDATEVKIWLSNNLTMGKGEFGDYVLEGEDATVGGTEEETAVIFCAAVWDGDKWLYREVGEGEVVTIQEPNDEYGRDGDFKNVQKTLVRTTGVREVPNEDTEGTNYDVMFNGNTYRIPVMRIFDCGEY